jgi:hypothetical protein
MSCDKTLIRCFWMRKRTASWLAGLLTFVLASPGIYGQSPDTSERLSDNPSVVAWLGASLHQPLKTRVGHRRDNNVFVLGVSRIWPVVATRRVELDFALEALPAVVATGVPRYEVLTLPEGSSTRLVGIRTAYGVGLMPLGLRLRVPLTQRIAFSLHAGGGLSVFSIAVPDPSERQLNYVGSAGADLSFGCIASRSVGVGFRFVHVSNGGSGPVNPGMNAGLFTLGVALGCREPAT